MTNTKENIEKAEEMLEEMAKRLNIQYDEEDGVDYLDSNGTDYSLKTGVQVRLK